MKKILVFIVLLFSLVCKSQNYHFDSLNLKNTFRGPITGIGVVNDTSKKVGALYDSSFWNNLSSFNATSEFTVGGGGKIVVSAYSGSGCGCMSFKNGTMLDKDTFRTDFKFTSINGSDFGFQVGWKTLNTNSAISLSFYNDVQPGADSGKLIVVETVNGSPTTLKSTTKLGISVNDSLEYLITEQSGVVTIKFINFTTSSSITFTNTVDYIFGSPNGVLHNTSVVTFYTGTSTYVIDRIEYASNAPVNALFAGVGNSITNGSYAGSAALRYASLDGSVILAGPGDVTASVVARLIEIWKYVKPKNALIMIGGNDIGFGISSGIWQPNLHTIYDTLTAHGINVIWLLATPRNAANMTTLNNYIIAQWPGKYIDTYTPLVGSGTSLNATYDAGDGVHPNQAGHALVFSTIVNSALYQAAEAFNFIRYNRDIFPADSDVAAIPSYGVLQRWVANHGGGGGTTVTSINTSANSLTFSPTTGAAIGDINTAHQNNFTVAQSMPSLGIGTTSPNYGLDIPGYNVTEASAHISDWYFDGHDVNNLNIFQNLHNVSGSVKYVANGPGASIQGGNTFLLFQAAPVGVAGASASLSSGFIVYADGTIGFDGSTTVPTSYADFRPSTTAHASARFEDAIAAPTSPHTGDMWRFGGFVVLNSDYKIIGKLNLSGSLAGTGGLPLLVHATDSTVQQIAQSSLTGVPNIYNVDGTLVGNRIVTMSSHTLDFNGGNVGIATSSPRQLLDILSTTNPQLRLTYTDNSVYTDFQVTSGGQLGITPTGTNSAIIKTGTASQYAGIGGSIFDVIADVGNTSTTETDLFSMTTPANFLTTDKQKIDFKFSGIYVGSTSSKAIQVYFGGTSIFTSGALAISSNSVWEVRGWIIRTSSSTARCFVTLSTPGLSVTLYDGYTALTGLDFTTTNIFKITGQASSVGAATNDIVLKMATGNWIPAAPAGS